MRILQKASVALGMIALLASFTKAQDTGGAQQPIPASSAPVGQGQPPKQAASGFPLPDSKDLTPDTNSLAGVQNLSLGLPPSGHTFLLPSFGVSSQAQANPYSSSVTGAPEWVGTTYLMGRLALDRSSGRSDLSVDYSTGASFSTGSNQGNYGIENLHLSDMFHSGRWSVLLGDQFIYTPQSPFGFGGIGSLNNLGVGLGSGMGSTGGFNNNFLPGQSVFINNSSQISNTVLGEVDYALSHRSSLTFSGSYGLLDFVSNGFQNSTNTTLQGGYNYLLDPLNSIAVIYRFNQLNFSGLSQSIDDHSVMLSFSRRITGRLSFQVGGGPNAIIYNSPLAGPSTVASWISNASISYQYRHLGMSLSYNHSVTGGSGILAGSKTDLISGSLSRSFGRDWDGGITAGYSRNQSLQQTSALGNNFTPQTWYTTAQITRRFVRYGGLSIIYSASGQSSLASVCALPACQASSLSNTITLSYNWGLRPIVLE